MVAADRGLEPARPLIRLTDGQRSGVEGGSPNPSTRRHAAPRGEPGYGPSMVDEQLPSQWIKNPGMPCPSCGRPLAAAEVGAIPPQFGEESIPMIGETICENPDCADFNGLKRGITSS